VAKVSDLEIAFVVEHEVLDPKVAVAYALRQCGGLVSSIQV
jgi:hypothetical protein